MLRRLVLLAVGLAGVLALATVAALPPPAAEAVPPAFTPSVTAVRGAFHVHSARSDGTGTVDEIAAAAARAGLAFVIVTDHGDGTREPASPAYRSGVLCIDGVEISTDGGHYIALGMNPAPYPLGGHPRDVIEDVGRLGGFGVAAHPGSPKPALRWADWDAAFDGLEWLNADSEWRDEFAGALGRVLLTYPFRPVETLAGLLDRPEAVLTRWEAALATRRVPALAGADAHARLGLGQGGDPYEDRVLARVPAYEVSFRAFVNHVLLFHPLTGDASSDAAAVLDAIRDGRIVTSIDGLARLSAFEVVAVSGDAAARPGEYLNPQGPVIIDAKVAAPEGTRLIVRRNGEVLHEETGGRLRIDIGVLPGAYRIEAQLPAALRSTSTVPWLLTNPIYIGLSAAHRLAASAESPDVVARSPVAAAAGTAEVSDGSSSQVSRGALPDGTPAVEWRFAVRGGAREQQYAAARVPLDRGLSAHERLQLRVASDAPRRLWVQLRAPGGDRGERWGATFYADEELRTVEIPLRAFRPLEPARQGPPPLDRIDSLLLVVDTVNSRPGAQGVLWITDLWLVQ